MPKGESFWNPYRLIQVKDNIDKKPPITDEKFTGKSGIIHCSLENLTPLFIGKNRYNEQLSLKRDGKYIIPGSSLKGMLRLLAEMVGGGCHVTDPAGKYETKYKACSKASYLCITCRMFGMMESGRSAKVHKGNVSISDAIIIEENPKQKGFQILLSNNGTRHEPFYRTPHTGKFDGKSRKLYFHQPKMTESVPNIPDNIRRNAWTVNALLPGCHFNFEVQFSNLTEEELEILLYVINLEEHVNVEIGENKIRLQGPMRHKIGNAKPLGMGSCRISIKKLIYFAPPALRFSTLQKTEDTIFEGDALNSEISKCIKKIAKDNSPTMQQLRKMMVWDERDPRDFRYPDYTWFMNPENSQKGFKMI